MLAHSYQPLGSRRLWEEKVSEHRARVSVAIINLDITPLPEGTQGRKKSLVLVCQETVAAPQGCLLAIWHQLSVQQGRVGIKAAIHKVLVSSAKLRDGTLGLSL